MDPTRQDLGPCLGAGPARHAGSPTSTDREEEPTVLVREVMTPDPVTVTPTTSVKAALALLAEHAITSMPVLDRHARLCGVVSEADLIRDLVAEDPRTHELPLEQAAWPGRARVVGEVMTPHAVTVGPDTGLAEAVELVTSTSVKSLPVVDHEGDLVGVLSRSDVVRVLARADEDLALEVDTLLASVGLGDWVADVSDGSVTLSGPDDARSRALARVVASTVPGVRDVLGT